MGFENLRVVYLRELRIQRPHNYLMDELNLNPYYKKMCGKPAINRCIRQASKLWNVISSHVIITTSPKLCKRMVSSGNQVLQVQRFPTFTYTILLTLATNHFRGNTINASVSVELFVRLIFAFVGIYSLLNMCQAKTKYIFSRGLMN